MANFNKNFSVYDMIDDDWDEYKYQLKLKNKKQKQNVQNRKRAK